MTNKEQREFSFMDFNTPHVWEYSPVTQSCIDRAKEKSQAILLIREDIKSLDPRAIRRINAAINIIIS